MRRDKEIMLHKSIELVKAKMWSVKTQASANVYKYLVKAFPLKIAIKILYTPMPLLAIEWYWQASRANENKTCLWKAYGDA